MKNIDTRGRVLVISTLISLSYLALQEIDFRVLLNLNLNFDPIKPLILALIIYIGAFWALFFKVRGERFITVLMFPAISIFSLSFLAEIIISSIFSSISQFGILIIATVIHWVFAYLTLLTVNILNTAYLNEIPLGQAGRAAQFVLTLIIAYVSYFLLFSNDISILLKVSGIALLSGILVYISLWSINLKIKKRFIASLNIALFLSFVGVILSIWPVPSPYLSLVLTLILYICLGISLEIREIISKWIMIEYVSLFFLVVFMLFLVAEWGINGIIL